MNHENKSRVVAIVQARMGSTRLPGKVLADIQGHAMLWHVVQRTRAAKSVDETIVATTTQAADEAIVAVCEALNIPYFRGSEKDVLDRYYQAALQYEAQVVVRITSDCPLIDSEIVDQTVREFLARDVDYASNVVVRTYPRGLDTEVMKLDALQRAWGEARQHYQRAHVTPYLYENPARFRIHSVSGEEDYRAYRWTVDTPEDLEFVRAVYARCKGDSFGWRETLQLMEREPHLVEINRAIAQKALQEG